MRIRMTTGTRHGFSSYGRNGDPLTLISGHYPSKSKTRKTPKTPEEIEQDSRVDKTHRD